MNGPRDKLIDGNIAFIENQEYSLKREATAKLGQNPYAIVVTCSDSRVSPDLIFSADIGELFVIRTAGLTIGNFALGSIEFAISKFDSSVIIVLGHTQCGAVASAMSDAKTEGAFRLLNEEIKLRIYGAQSVEDAERLNVVHACNLIASSPVVKRYLETGEAEIIPAIYNMHTGKVEFLFDYE